MTGKFKVNGYSFAVRKSVIFSFASFLNWAQLSKEGVCPFWSKFFPLRVEAEANSKSQKVEENHGDVPCFPKKTYTYFFYTFQ